MKSPDGANTPSWYDTAKPPRYPSPPKDLRVDVCDAKATSMRVVLACPKGAVTF